MIESILYYWFLYGSILFFISMGLPDKYMNILLKCNTNKYIYLFVCGPLGWFLGILGFISEFFYD